MNNQISSYQMIAVILPLIFAPIMMNFSRLLFSSAGRGGWLVILLIAICTWLLLTLIFAVAGKEQTTVLENCTLLFHRKPTELFLFFIAFVFLLFGAAALDVGIYIVKLFFLPRTPQIIIALLLFLPAIAMTYYGFRSYTHMATLLIPAMMLFLLMFLFTKHNYRLEELFPLTEFQWQQVLTVTPGLFLTAPGILATFFVLPILKDHNHLYRKALIPGLLVLILGSFVYAMALMYFGGNTLTQLILPFYNLSSIFKGTLAERIEILFMITILPTVMVSSSFGIALANLILQNLFIKTYAHRKVLPILLTSTTVLTVSVLTAAILPLWTVWKLCNQVSLILTLLLLLLTFAANRKRKRGFK